MYIKFSLEVLLAMFNPDNIDLDFDDDFSLNVFCKRVTAGKGDAVERARVCDKIKPSQNSFKRGLPESPNQLFKEEPNPDTSDKSKRTSLSGALTFPVAIAPREKNLKRPHLQDEKLHKRSLSHERLLPRKFPGPAGLLPDKPFKQISDLPLPMEKSWDEEEGSSEKEKSVIYSQSSGSVFLESAYQKLVTDFNLNESNNLLNKYTVEWVKRTALSKGLQGRKIPFLGLVVHAVNYSMPDPVLMLRDPTGEMSGSLHREVWVEMGGKLRAGIALALRQVGVLITGVIRRQIYLNITMNNILAIYSPSENEKEVETTTVNKVSQSELIKNFEERLGASRTAPNQPSSPSALFTTTDDSNDSFANKEEIRNLQNKLENVMDVAEGTGKRGNHREGVLGGLGFVLKDTDFIEDMRVSEGEDSGRIVSGAGVRMGTSSQALSPTESLIFEEVLSGINLDEFDM